MRRRNIPWLYYSSPYKFVFLGFCFNTFHSKAWVYECWDSPIQLSDKHKLYLKFILTGSLFGLLAHIKLLRKKDRDFREMAQKYSERQCSKEYILKHYPELSSQYDNTSCN